MNDSQPDDLFETRPWMSPGVPAAQGIVGMLSDRETRLFRDLAQRYWTGAGAVIDAGSFLGRSAACFAEGLRRNPSFDPQVHRIHCFDDFVCHDELTVRAIERGLGEQLAIGDSTRHLFDRQVAPYRDVIEVHAGDFHDCVWPDAPIELLMVDVAKLPSLGQRVVSQFFGRLIPGRSLVLHQDYHHIWLPHIHVVMEFLADHFELVAPRVGSTAVFRLTSAIRPDLLQRAAEYDFTHAEQCDLFDAAIRRTAPDDRAYLELARLMLRRGVDQPEHLMTQYDQLVERHRDFDGESWTSDSAQARVSLLEAIVHHCCETAAPEAARRCVEELIKVKPDSGRAWQVLAHIELASGRLQQAEHAVRRSLSLPRLELGGYLLPAGTLAALGATDEAEALLLEDLLPAAGKLLQLTGHVDLLCSVWEQQGATERQVGVIAALLERQPEQPDVHTLAARCAFLHGDRDRARDHMRRAVELGLPEQRSRDLLAPLGVKPGDLG